MQINRVSWLDQLKAFAVIIGLFTYFSPLLIQDFNPVNINNFSKSFSINIIKNIEIFTQMGLILISAFSFKFINFKSSKWFLKKFVLLVIISSLILTIGQDYRSLFWQILHSLWFYFPLFYLINQQKSIWVKNILWGLILVIYCLSLPLWGDLADKWYIGNILFGYFPQQVSFNVFSGLPMVVLSSVLAEYIVENRQVVIPRLHRSIIILSIILGGGWTLNHYWLTSAIVYSYPPHYFEFLSGALVVLIAMAGLAKYPLNFLNDFGRRGLLFYWGYWLFASLIVEWNKIGLYKFNFISSSLLIFLTLGIIIGINNQRKKHE